MTTSKRQGWKGAKVSRSQRSSGTSQWVAMPNKSGFMWTDVISRERLWCLHLSFQHVFGSFANIASMIVPYWSILWQFFYVFLCQVFIPAIYKNSTDIQLAESISPLDLQSSQSDDLKAVKPKMAMADQFVWCNRQMCNPIKRLLQTCWSKALKTHWHRQPIAWDCAIATGRGQNASEMFRWFQMFLLAGRCWTSKVG